MGHISIVYCGFICAIKSFSPLFFTGRQVAVDWAVAKDKFVATQPGAKKEEKVTAEKPAPESDSEEEEEVEENKYELLLSF